VNKIRKGDKVILNSGKDKGKQGIVLSILKNNRVVVEGLNMVKKHTKPNPAKGDQGGLVSKEIENWKVYENCVISPRSYLGVLKWIKYVKAIK